MKVFLPEVFEGFESIESAEIYYYNETTDLTPADVILGNVKRVFDNPKDYSNLKFIQLQSAGFDGIPLDELATCGIRVANARGLYSVPIAEYVLAHVLSQYKSITAYRHAQNEKQWDHSIECRTLEGKRALVLGTGSIGFEISKRLRVFDVRVDGVNSNGRLVEGFDCCFSLDSVQSMLHDYDLVIAALPSNEATRHLVGDAFFSAMKTESIFINVGRGDLVQTQSIIASTSHLMAIILDVFEIEPLPLASELWDVPNLIITPHRSILSDQHKTNTRRYFHKNIERFVRGESVENLLVGM